MNVFEALFGGVLKALGSVLGLFYDAIPSYGIAIILLTVLVRLVLIPLTVKQTRSMQAMQAIQPKVKELQRKHKGNRQKMNEELMKLYKEHQVNPLGGCLPLLLQLPVFFALFTVLRATVGGFGLPAEEIPMSTVRPESVVCRPDTAATVNGPPPSAVVCEDGQGNVESYPIERWQSKRSRVPIARAPSELFLCRAEAASRDDSVVGGFLCESRLGPGHLPHDSGLFEATVRGSADFLGMELACSPTQAASEENIRQCAGPGTEAGAIPAIPYFGLVVLMVATTWYQQRQMQRASAGPGARQAQMLARIMPIFLGVISISISAGVLVYWVTTNAWQIGQQHIMLRSRVKETAGGGDGKGKTSKPKSEKPAHSGKASSQKAPQGDGSRARTNARSRKKRRKR
ncbi:MAG: YidC/Oxa1 family membrane protein insertase [Actinomycetota bacterium]